MTCLAGPITALHAQKVDMETLLLQALDQKNDFEVLDKPLSEAFMRVAEQTGVAISISPQTLALLPDGAATRMTAHMKNVPLREGLAQLLSPLGMRFRVVEDHLEVEPTDALRRVGRRATWTELETLQWLAAHEWKGQTDEQAVKLFDKVDFQLEGPQAAAGSLTSALNASGPGTLLDVLNDACRRLNWAWYPAEDRIVVLSAAEQMRRDLGRSVTLKADHRPLAEVLLELAAQAGVTVRFDPNAIGTLARETQVDFSVRFVNVPLEQALEVISGATGLDYHVESDAIRFSNAAPTAAADRVALVLVVPGRGEIPIYESDLPDDVRTALDDLLDRLIQAITPPKDASNKEQ